MAIVKIPEEQLDLTNTNTAIAAKMPLAGGTFTGDITMAQGKSVKFQNSQIVENGAGNPIIGDGNGNGLVVAADGGGAALFTNNGGSYTELVTQNDVKSTYSSSGTDPVNGTAVASAISSKQDNLSAAQLNAANSGITAAKVTSYDSHIVNTSNPHSVTKAQVGLGNVNNTSDADKPISTATMQALTEVGYSEWQKPSDWIDITSGALNNSIYLLVGHAADYSKFPYFGCNVVLSDTTHNFKLYIDYNLQGTYASGTDVKLSWQTLNLSTGSETTSPEALKTHVIRITPENSADTIAEYKSVRYASGTTSEYQGVLWAHFAVNSIGNVAFAQYSPQVVNQDLVALTALGDNLHITGTSIERLVGNTQDKYRQCSQYLAKLPVIEVDTVTAIGGAFNHAGPLKRAKLIVNNSITAYNRNQSGLSTSFASGNIEEIEVNKPIIMDSWTSTHSSLFRVSNIKKLPAFDFSASQRLNIFLTEDTNLEDTILDVSTATNLKQIDVSGTSSKRQDGLKGLYVSSSAPFDYATAPQINVPYTGLDRAALVNLFKSMPYNVGYTVVGSPTISSGVASGFSADDSLATSLALPQLLSNFEMVTKVKWGDVTFSDYQFIIGSTYLGLYITAYKKHIRLYASTTGSSWNIASGVDGEHTFEENDVIWIKTVKDSTSLKIYYSTDNQNWILDNSFEVTDPIKLRNNYALFGIGSNTSKYFTGSIYLNDTYININGIPWFTGKAAMTKTCSVVGCTGTADLTADDKAIATGKGWELTVA